MRWIKNISNWLERRWATPSFAGWVILGLTGFFWLAAANTLAGFLYVLSGTCLALLAIAAWLPSHLLKDITVTRSPVYPVSVGETLSLTVRLDRHRKGQAILQCQDCLPETMSQIPWHTLEWHPKKLNYTWNFGIIPQQRGIFHWQTLVLKTAAPLGLFCSLRSRQAPISVLIYPEILPLTACPILDQFLAPNTKVPEQQSSNQLGQDGTTRSLRPYRYGDALRLIHWRSSAKFNELRTRELEIISGESPITLALNSSDRWSSHCFELAVIAAASLYHYAEQHGMSIQLWTAGAGLQHGSIPILETLATVQPQESNLFDLPAVPVLLLTESTQTCSSLPEGSHTIIWTNPESSPSRAQLQASLLINPQQDLMTQLQHRPVEA